MYSRTRTPTPLDLKSSKGVEIDKRCAAVAAYSPGPGMKGKAAAEAVAFPDGDNSAHYSVKWRVEHRIGPILYPEAHRKEHWSHTNGAGLRILAAATGGTMDRMVPDDTRSATSPRWNVGMWVVDIGGTRNRSPDEFNSRVFCAGSDREYVHRRM
jgi:hypothetical protein